ncbi:MAG: acetylornithine/succinylornithine family transaminase [Luteitalea sp.]|nr:acetylornithine/succinylornithine family transaminase [Luteitalea sp.]
MTSTTEQHLSARVVGSEVHALEAQHIVQTYRRAPVVFVRGEGVRLYDSEGKEYLDLLSGIGVAAVGHGNPRLADALAEQARTLAHTSNLYFHPLQGQVAARLAALSGLPRAFFCNSGTEAVEACLKFARRYWYTAGTPRHEIVALEQGFAGRTLGSLSVTWDPHYRAPFEPLVPGVTFVPAGDEQALRAAVTKQTAAIIAEPIQGEGGVRPLSSAFAAVITDVCTQTGALLIADEVQCGLGRTGQPFYFQVLGLRPDLVSVGKALGGGMPVGAALLSERVASAVSYGDHGTTYGGNLLACRAALVVLDALTGTASTTSPATLPNGGLLAHIQHLAPLVEARLREIATRHPMVVDVRGAGLIWGVELDRDAAPIVEAALARGLLINRTAERVVRLLPSYIITEGEIDLALARLDAALAEGQH